MNKKIVSVLAVTGVMVGIACIGGLHFSANNAHTQTTSIHTNTINAEAQTTTTYISVEEAKKMALDYANLSAETVSYTKAKLDYEHGHVYYDIEFYHNNTEYDYELDAYTGALVSYSHDTKHQQTHTHGHTTTTTANISLEEAKTIALTRANLTADQVTFIELELDYDDGLTVYQISFVSGTTEYEVEVNATNGNIVDYDVESIYS